MAIHRHTRSRPASRAPTTLLCSILSCFALGGCSSLVTPLPPIPAVTVALPEIAIADDVSVTPVVVQVDTRLAADKRVVALTSTAGQFVGDVSALVPDAAGRTVALLRAPADSTTVVVRATVNGSAATAEMVYKRARVERVDLVLEQFTLGAGLANDIKIGATLRRAVGLPSPGGVVTFTATGGADQRPIGRFLPPSAVADAQATATVRFTSADPAVRGRVDIRAVSDTAVAVAPIEVIAP